MVKDHFPSTCCMFLLWGAQSSGMCVWSQVKCFCTARSDLSKCPCNLILSLCSSFLPITYHLSVCLSCALHSVQQCKGAVAPGGVAGPSLWVLTLDRGEDTGAASRHHLQVHVRRSQLWSYSMVHTFVDVCMCKLLFSCTHVLGCLGLPLHKLGPFFEYQYENRVEHSARFRHNIGKVQPCFFKLVF